MRAFFDGARYLATSRPQIEVRVQLLRSLLGELRGRSILDMGCGDGSLSVQFAGDNRLTLVDLSENMLRAARERLPSSGEATARFIRSDLDSFETAEVFDLVLCVGVLAHVPSLDVAVGRLARLVAPGGCLVLQFSEHDHVVTRALRLSYRMRRQFSDVVGYELTPTRGSEIRSILSRHGMRVSEEKHYWPMLSGMSRLPARFVSKYLYWSSRSPYFSRLGAEVLIVARKATS